MIRHFRVIKPQTFLSFFKQNKPFLILCSLLVLGVLVGSISAGNMYQSQSHDFGRYFSDYLLAHKTHSYMSLVWHAFVSGIPFLISTYCFGLFILGTPICAFIPFLYGLGSGTACGYLYAQHGLKGTAFCMLTVIPPAFAYSILLVIASVDGIAFSKSLASCYIKNTPAVLPAQRFKQYHIHFAVYLIAFIGIAFFDGLLSRVFMDVFNF